MPSDPQFARCARYARYASVYGSEYEHPIVGTHEYNVPCAVCLTITRETVMIIPARTECPTS